MFKHKKPKKPNKKNQKRQRKAVKAKINGSSGFHSSEVGRVEKSSGSSEPVRVQGHEGFGSVRCERAAGGDEVLGREESCWGRQGVVGEKILTFPRWGGSYRVF